MKRIDVSIGICAYNEEKNIELLLDSVIKQITKQVNIVEIIVISDGSTDRTNEIVKKFSLTHKIRLIIRKERYGKYIAINKFLKIALSPVLVLLSADIILDRFAIENLCVPFLYDDDLGITGAHPIPNNSKDSFFGFIVNLQWDLHHRLSLIKPKFGEMIAFRNVIEELPPVFVDEEQIACLIKDKGFNLKYISNSLVYNKGPENIRDFLLQRRRNHAGHLMLKYNYGYEVATLNDVKILRCLFKRYSLQYFKRLHWLIGAILLEIFTRLLARFDILLKRYHYNYVWKIAKSTKIVLDS